MKKIRKQKGFAMLEVLVAALIMTIGGVAYMRLQQMGLQYGHNNYARTQGIVIAEDFVDTLRNNLEHFQHGVVGGHIISGNAGANGVNPIDLSQQPCTVSTSTASNGDTSQSISCNTKTIFELQNRFVQQQLQASVSNSVLCYRVNRTGFVRVTYLWKDNSAASKDIDLTTLNSGGYCPADFNTAVDAKLEENMVTIYAQL